MIRLSKRRPQILSDDNMRTMLTITIGFPSCGSSGSPRPAFVAACLGAIAMLASPLASAASARSNETGAASTSGTAASGMRASHVIADLALELLWIKPGTFLMGSSPDEAAHKAEYPQTRVTLSNGFWLGKTEVTQAQYEAIIGTNPSTFKTVGPLAPVERVSWEDAMKFCAMLTDRERKAGRLPAGYVFTLPTEAQWEYAARAGTTGQYSRDPEIMSWHIGNSGDTTHVVGTKEPNPWGLYDMSGNVLEWCFDWYGDYPGGAVTDPIGPTHGYYRIARGGSWRADIQVGRSAARAGGPAGRLDYTLGFRLALAVRE
jgi:formylglycine-generating enzyme required for sulfatase activity